MNTMRVSDTGTRVFVWNAQNHKRSVFIHLSLFARLLTHLVFCEHFRTKVVHPLQIG